VGGLGARPAHHEAPAPSASAGYLTEGKKKRAWSCLREAYQGVPTRYTLHIYSSVESDLSYSQFALPSILYEEIRIACRNDELLYVLLKIVDV
jgi:hypothetical protein